MEGAIRTAARASTALRSVALRQTVRRSRQAFQQQGRRGFSSSTATTALRTAFHSTVLGALLLAGGAGLYTLNATAHNRPTLAESPEPITPSSKPSTTEPSRSPFTPTQADYQAVYNAIAAKLLDQDDYDDGSYAPILLRLGWHSAGTYDAATHTGGSHGATMRFPAEGDLAANAGLRHARDFLESVKAEFPWITYADLWTLGAVCAVQEMGGPGVPWRPGRGDRDATFCAPDGRLPDGAQGAAHVRAVFGRMGFDDREMVALIGAHAVGRCHADRSGFDGPWTFSPITFTNEFFRLLLEEEWREREWEGPRQWQDARSRTLMMLPTDHCLLGDAAFREHVVRYAEDQEVFFEEFSEVLVKLFELGVPFEEQGAEAKRMEFERTE